MATTKWVLDPSHSEILFRVRHMMITNVKGEFRNFSAVIDGEKLTHSQVRVVIDSSSVYTNNEDRDKHLRSADFFDVENHSELVFESTSIKKVDKEDYKLTGLLTIKGITKTVTFDVEFGGINKDPWGNEKAGFSLEGKINRKEWGLNWNTTLETGGVLVSEDVRIQAEVQFIKQS